MEHWRDTVARHRRAERFAADSEQPARRQRRRVVAVLTVVLGAAVLAWTLRIAPGDPRFYLATVGLAAVWLAGALAAGRPLRATEELGRQRAPRLVVTGLAVGLVLLVVFLAGAVVVARVPVLREPVQELLDHARWGSLPAVLALTALNGVVEELFFRGGLYDAFGGRGAVLGSTAVYTVVTALAGIPLLALAGLLLGLVVALLRRLTHGVLAPIVTHLTWSLGMLLLLGPLLDLLER
ncbi:CPBP family intramembrane glutamic endopeptidase [Arsenicicoccus sp. oral taxon 190]|uniref:CPBP family intramembrane glutamic endopeptidase n=1 Tax=Arsenicicoccus sp. oral taxon 190 TaxID=1658671 RepID=UPI000679FCF0|nr:CPBP family intramembrane glutamic endopeptidase [Arsenicicoccus sp. oral taxon 190]AKT50326.1 hypothetical protein ADJ73_01500 [Arsenicicoccus sp. oral taxon 190]